MFSRMKGRFVKQPKARTQPQGVLPCEAPPFPHQNPAIGWETVPLPHGKRVEHQKVESLEEIFSDWLEACPE
jgi:hypothetical protein